MSYEQSKFGDGSAAGSGNVVTTVNNQYGARDTGDTNGVSKTEGFSNELTIDLNGGNVGDEAYALLAPELPAGSVIKEAYVEVTEAFVLGGTTPTILVGTETSEVTNGLVISEAQAEAIGTYDVGSTLTGTWAAPLAAATTVGLALGGTTPTVTAAGKAKLVIRYTKI